MARGKYAQRAADRRAELEVTTDLASYQHRVAQLTAENRELREQMEEQRRAAAAVERRLRAERDEGVAPQVEAMRLAREAERAKAAERLRAAAQFFGNLIQDNGWGLRADDWAKLSALVGAVPELITPRGIEANRSARRATPRRTRLIADASKAGRFASDGYRTGPPPSNVKDMDG